MYNKNAKQGFLLSRAFNQFELRAMEDMLLIYEPTEERLGRDLCTFSLIEHRSVIDQLFDKEHDAFGKWIGYNMIRRYLRWCVKSKIPNSVDSLDDFLPRNIDVFAADYLAGPEDLRDRMDRALSNEDRVEPDIVIRAFLWLLFMGIPEQDVYTIEEKDVDLGRLQVNVDDRSFQIHPLAINSITKVVESKTFLLTHPNYTTTVNRYDSTFILRNRRSNPSYNTIRNTLLKMLRRAGMTETELSPLYTFKSGYFYRVWQSEKRGKAPDFVSYVLVRDKQVAPEFIHRRCQLIMIDYCKWKLANNYI